MVDILTVGFSGMAAIRKVTQKLKLAIHGHRAMHGALTRDPKHGISMLALAKISRLLGTDQLHIGTAGIGKMHGSESEELSIEEEIEQQKIKANTKKNRLEQNWFDIKPVLAVASGGVSPLQIPKIVKTMGNDIIIQAGGGVHGHPDGTKSGAKAMRQSIEATIKKIPLIKYSKTNKELEQAFKKWKH